MININKTKFIILISLMLFVLFTVNISSAEKIKLKEINRMKTGYLPTPFSADDIRRYNQNRSLKFLVEAEGKPNSYTQFTFRKGDKLKSDYDILIFDSNEKQINSKNKVQTKWAELQAHASYPEKTTEVKYEKKSISLGIFDCWVYTSYSTKGSKKNINITWFAKTMPGPPILVIHKINGKTVLKMTMIKTVKKIKL